MNRVQAKKSEWNGVTNEDKWKKIGLKLLLWWCCWSPAEFHNTKFEPGQRSVRRKCTRVYEEGCEVFGEVDCESNGSKPWASFPVTPKSCVVNIKQETATWDVGGVDDAIDDSLQHSHLADTQFYGTGHICARSALKFDSCLEKL